MKHSIGWLLIIVGCGVGLSGCINLRTSGPDIEKQLLSRTPIGSDYSTVEDLAADQNWELDKPLSLRNASFRGRGFPYVTGDYYTYSVLGRYVTLDYILPLETTVGAFWGFDQNDQLTDIKVRVMTDGP